MTSSTPSTPIAVICRNTFLHVLDEVDDYRASTRKRYKSLDFHERHSKPLYVKYTKHLVQSAANLRAERKNGKEKFKESLSSKFRSRTSGSFETIGTKVGETNASCSQNGVPHLISATGYRDNATPARLGCAVQLRAIERFTFVDYHQVRAGPPKQFFRRSCSLPPERTSPDTPSASTDTTDERAAYGAVLMERAARLRFFQGVRTSSEASQGELHESCFGSTNDEPLDESPRPQLLDAIDQGNLTTLMLCGLPPLMSKRALSDSLVQFDVRSLIDYMHVPPNHRGPASPKFAFLNFVSPEAAKTFVQLSEKFPWSLEEGGQRPWLQLARIQGADATRQTAWLQKFNRWRRRHGLNH